MTIPHLSSINASYVAAAKTAPAIQTPKNTQTIAPEEKTKWTQAIKKPENLSKIAIVFTGAAFVAGVINVISNRRNSKTVNELSENTNRLFNSLKDEFSQLLDKLKNKAESSEAAKNEVPERIEAALKELQNQIAQIASKENGNSSSDNINDALSEINKFKDDISKMIEDMLSSSQKNFSENAQNLQKEVNSATTIMNAVLETINTQNIAKSSKQREILNKQIKLIEELGENLKNIASKESENIQQNTAEAIDKALKNAGNTNAETQKSFGEIQKLLEEIKETLQKTTRETQPPAQTKITKSLKDIQFEKGTALNKDGTPFDGIISDALKNGKKIQWTYENGKIKEAITGDVKKTYEARKEGRIITIQDSSPVTRIFKILKNSKKTTIKEYKKFIENGLKTKAQTLHFEHDGKNYVRASLRTREETDNPVLYAGIFGQRGEKAINAKDLNVKFGCKGIEDDAYKCYSLVNTPQNNSILPKVLNQKSNSGIDAIYGYAPQGEDLSDINIVDLDKLQDLFKFEE